jgi:hypothetical protein
MNAYPGAGTTAVGSTASYESWIVWDYGNDGGERAVAWYPSEIQALRHAVDLDYLVRVTRINPGGIREQLRTEGL